MYRYLIAAFLTAGILCAQDETAPQLPVSDPVCAFFGSKLAYYFSNLLPSQSNGGQTHVISLGSAKKLVALTRIVAEQLAPPGGGRTAGSDNLANSRYLIDQYLFSAMQSAGVQPADTTTDWEFVRRIYLDLTGRIPSPAATLAFVNSTSATKRSDLVEQLLASTEYTDKWTMYFGDLYKNVSQNAQITTYPSSVAAFYQYIKTSVSQNKPYDQMAREIITGAGANSYDVATGQMNFIVDGVVTGGPVQDIYDQQVSNVADVFLGISHLNCLLCHNGRRSSDGIESLGSAADTLRRLGHGIVPFPHEYFERPGKHGGQQPPLLDRRRYRHKKLSAQYDDGKPSAAAADRDRFERSAHVHLRRRNSGGRPELPPGARGDDHRRSAVRAGDRELHVGLLFRCWSGGSARYVRPGPPRS